MSFDVQVIDRTPYSRTRRGLPDLLEVDESIADEPTATLRRRPPALDELTVELLEITESSGQERTVELTEPCPAPVPIAEPISIEPPAPRVVALPRVDPWAVSANGALVIFAVALAIPALIVALWSLPYQLTPVDLRPEHWQHPWMRAAGPVGLWTGIGGTALMVAMLSYSVRKWLLSWTWLGSPVYWLRFHIVCGVMGPVYIFLHVSAMMPRGFVAVGFWCMVLVAASGLFGRYVYGQFPRTAAGRSERLDDALEALVERKADLVAQTSGTGAESLTDALELCRHQDREVYSVLGWVTLDHEIRRRVDLVRYHVGRAQLPADVARGTSAAMVAQLQARRSVAGFEAIGRLFRWWHLFHEPLAKAMYIIAGLHILQAIIIGGALTHLWSP